MTWLPSSAFGSKISPTQNVVDTIPVCQGYGEDTGGAATGGDGDAVVGLGVGVGIWLGAAVALGDGEPSAADAERPGGVGEADVPAVGVQPPRARAAPVRTATAAARTPRWVRAATAPSRTVMESSPAP